MMGESKPLILGIRHHGPGSARSVLRALAEWVPDAILIEGPPDAAGVLALAQHAQMQPPVALLIYVPDAPRRAAYYPFAEFSPEWQAIQYGFRHNIPVRFIDLPQQHWLALDQPPATSNQSPTTSDPLTLIAQAAGFSDGERWWEYMVEQRQDSSGLFSAILELMAAAREAAGQEMPADRETQLRESHMRQSMRAAQREGFQRIAVVCGAWHAPALAALDDEPADVALLKGLPRVQVQATWVPWTYGRLANWSGYGAGIDSPGYYGHLWTAFLRNATPNHVTVRWMAQVAHLLREQDLDALYSTPSPASVIEAVRLAESLSALRGAPLPGLPELNEAVQAVFCFGNDLPMQLIAEKLIVGTDIGQVPDETPALPLQRDLQREQRRLKLPSEAVQRALDLDLRNPNALERSHLLHRLNLLDIPWGKLDRVTGAKGTFHELWQLQWEPGLSIAVIEASVWGNTIHDAATSAVRASAAQANDLPMLTALVEQTLLADLPEAVSDVMARLQSASAVTSDVPLLMDALPPLVSVLRYGNVRQTDTAMVAHVVDGLVTRICVGLPAACASLNDDAAQDMYARFINVHGAMALIAANELKPLQALWQQTLTRMLDQQGLHGLIAGRCCRLLFDQASLPAEDVARRMGLALSPVNVVLNADVVRNADPAQAAAWIEGFLRGSGLLLLHNTALWDILDKWVMALNGDTFAQLLPLLRRTFATYPAPERRQMGERAKRTSPESGTVAGMEPDFDPVRAQIVLPLVTQILGLHTPPLPHQEELGEK